MEPTKLTVDEVKTMMDRGDTIVFLDTRNKIAWGETNVKLPGAIRVPIEMVNQYIDELPRDSTIVTYCT
ncbi:MAG: hypothetical protein SVO26_04985 [Chloroflexota bacterium]|nr:hypothetical protein [Chloroflexota bacterium]